MGVLVDVDKRAFGGGVEVFLIHHNIHFFHQPITQKQILNLQQPIKSTIRIVQDFFPLGLFAKVREKEGVGDLLEIQLLLLFCHHYNIFLQIIMRTIPNRNLLFLNILQVTPHILRRSALIFYLYFFNDVVYLIYEIGALHGNHGFTDGAEKMVVAI